MRNDSPAVRQRLTLCDVSDLQNPELYAAACARVSDERRRRTDRLRRLSDRCLSLGAGLLLRDALRDCGLPAQPELREGPRGKPFFPEYPGFCFSLSHAGTYAACAVGHADLGCDIEREGRDGSAVARRFFLPEEASDIANCPTPEEQNRLFTRYWTLKESFMKATGEGMRLSPDRFRVILSDTGAVLCQSHDSRSYLLREYFCLDGYACAVCSVGEFFAAEPRIIPIRELLSLQPGNEI